MNQKSLVLFALLVSIFVRYYDGEYMTLPTYSRAVRTTKSICRLSGYDFDSIWNEAIDAADIN